MELHDYLRVLRKRWATVVLVMLTTLGIAALLTILSPRTYESEMQFFVSTSVNEASSDQLLQGNNFTQQRVKSYAALMTSPKVLDPVAAAVGQGTTSTSLGKKVAATVPLDTVLIDVAVRDSDPEQARAIGEAITESFPAVVAEMETPNNGNASPVKVTVSMPPATPTSPIRPIPWLNLAVGLALGLLMGLAAALLRDYLDASIKTPSDTEGLHTLPTLGTITFDADAKKHPLIVHSSPRSPRAEAFRSLRTNLQFVDSARRHASIVVTSSLPGEGKSTTTANLALSLAETGSTVCVIEGDLRRPRLLDYMGYEGAVGLTDVLIEHATIDDVLQQFADTSLWLIGSGMLPPNPSELLGGARMKQVLADLLERFDYVIIDAPPLLPVTDAAVLSTITDGVLVVVGAGVATTDHLRRALQSIEAVQGRLLGLVFNRLPRKESTSYDSYDYNYVPETPRGRARRRQGVKA